MIKKAQNATPFKAPVNQAAPKPVEKETEDDSKSKEEPKREFGNESEEEKKPTEVAPPAKEAKEEESKPRIVKDDVETGLDDMTKQLQDLLGMN